MSNFDKRETNSSKYVFVRFFHTVNVDSDDDDYNYDNNNNNNNFNFYLPFFYFLNRAFLIMHL